MGFDFSSLLPIAGAVVGNMIAPGIGGAIGSAAGGALGGALSQNKAGGEAKDTFQQAQANLAPWMQTGQQANTALGGFLGVGPDGWNANAAGVKPFGVGDFKADPGYEWLKDQGLSAVMNKRSAMGGVLSGKTLTDLTTYGTGLADQSYQQAYQRYNTNIDNIYKRLMGLSQTGENAATGTGVLAGGVAGAQEGIGNANAAGAVGTGNAITGGINNWLLMQAIQGRAGGGGSTPTGWGGGTVYNPLDPGISPL